MLKLWNSFISWLEGFLFGNVHSLECEYCDFEIAGDTYPDEDALIAAAMEHACSVRSRLSMVMVSCRFGCYYESYNITKQLW